MKKKGLLLFLVLSIIGGLFFFSPQPVNSDGSLTKVDTDKAESTTFYASDKEAIKELFQVDLSDLTSGTMAVDWLMDNKTYIVAKRTPSGKVQIYWNTPNLQQFCSKMLPMVTPILPIKWKKLELL